MDRWMGVWVDGWNGCIDGWMQWMDGLLDVGRWGRACGGQDFGL